MVTLSTVEVTRARQVAATVIFVVFSCNTWASEFLDLESPIICMGQTYNPKAFDYRDPDGYIQNEIRNLERFHFNADVRSGTKGQTGYLIVDLAFILHNVPNHHAALTVVGQYYLAGGADHGYPHADCFFLLAQQFRANDGLVALVYGVFLAKSDRLSKAEQQYKLAIQHLSEPAEAHYNLGLLYLQSGRSDLALEHARIAYRRGYPLPGLRNKLLRIDLIVD